MALCPVATEIPMHHTAVDLDRSERLSRTFRIPPVSIGNLGPGDEYFAFIRMAAADQIHLDPGNFRTDRDRCAGAGVHVVVLCQQDPGHGDGGFRRSIGVLDDDVRIGGENRLHMLPQQSLAGEGEPPDGRQIAAGELIRRHHEIEHAGHRSPGRNVLPRNDPSGHQSIASAADRDQGRAQTKRAVDVEDADVESQVVELGHPVLGQHAL